MLEHRAARRFWKKVDKSGDCWVWTGARNQDDYGRFGAERDKVVYAHRYAYELSGTLIPADVLVRHLCDNPPCVNPAHLAVGTQKQNMQDAVARDRICRGSKIPSAKLTESDVLAIRNRFAAGSTQAQLAHDFGVNQTTISRVIRRESWAHV